MKRRLLVSVFLLTITPFLYAQTTPEQEQRAAERFLTLLQRTPRQGTALDRVYGYHVDTGQLDAFVNSCRVATEKLPNDAKAFLLLGLVLGRRGDDAAAIDALTKAEELDPNDAMASYYLGQMLVPAGKLREAAEALERAVKRKPGRTELLAVLQLLGRVYERFGDKEKSGGIWTTLEETFPDDLDIQSRIAETLEEENRLDEALIRYEKLAERSTKDNYARVRYTLSAADILIRLGRKQEAIDRFETLLTELSGDSWLADSIRDRVERIFVRQADFAGLVEYYRKRLIDKPNDLETIRRHAVALVRLSRLAEAKELLTKTLERAPNDVRLRLALIDILLYEKEFDEAEKQYENLDKADPNNPDYVTQWGLVVLENKKHDEPVRKANAAAVWKRLTAARDKDPAMTIMVADLLAGAKIDDEAEALYLKAIELMPNDPSYREFLGYFYHRKEEKDKAVAVLNQTVEGNRRTAASLAQLAGIFRALGYVTESLDAMKQAVELAPDDFALKIRYIDMLVEQRNADEAKAQLAVTETLVHTEDEQEQFTQREIKVYEQTNEWEQIADDLESRISNPEFYRLAMFRRALNDTVAAGVAIEKALEATPDSLLVLRTAADLYGRNYDYEKSAVIYERLAAVDTSRRVDHLKRLAATQSDLGQMDKALETARLVMAVGAGSAANSKFYADMLLAVGQREDGIEALRRAVRLDPSDKSMLTALAETLASGNDFDEAIELYWRIFERTEDLQGRMSVVAKMSQHYQSARRFDQLIERFRQRSLDAANRRESAYCAAQAFASVQDYVSARKSLETLLTDIDGERTTDTFLLAQLSKLAEDQKDLGSAVRYQEMLCDLTDTPQDRDRLQMLYYANNQKDKSQALYFRNIMEKTDLADQLDALDTLLGREEYQAAKTVIDRLDMQHPADWEILYRNMLLALWTKDDETAKRLAEALRNLPLDESELSAAKKRDANKQAATPSQTPGRAVPTIYGPGYSAWQFPQANRNTGIIISQAQVVGESEEAVWTRKNQDILRTIFRNKLVLEQYYFQRGNSTPPAKPLFKPETAGDARFAAVALIGTENPDDFKTETDDRLRLRLDMFLKAAAISVHQKAADTAEGLLTDAEVDQIKRRLGASAGEGWQGTLLGIYFEDIFRPQTLKAVDEKGIDAVFGIEQYKQFGVDATQLETMRKQYEQYVKDLRKAEDAAKADATPTEEKIAWILDYVERSLLTAEGANLLTAAGANLTRGIAYLRNQNREDDLARLETAIEKAGKENPRIFLSMAISTISQNPNSMLYGIYSSLPDGDIDDALSSEERFAELKKWLLKARDGFARQKGKPASATGGTNPFNTLTPQSLAYIINADVQKDLALLRKNLSDAARQAFNEGSAGPRRVLQVVGGVAIVGGRAGNIPESTKTITLTDADWSAILEFEEQIYRDINLYFEVCRDVDRLQPSPRRQPPKRGALSSPVLQNIDFLLSESGPGNLEYVTQIINVQGRSPLFDAGIGAPTLQVLAQLDRLVNSDPLRKDKAKFQSRFDEYLSEKANSGDEFLRRTIGDYAANKTIADALQSNDVKKFREMVAEQVESARKADVEPPENFEILLAVFACWDKQYVKAMEIFDGLTTTSAAEIKTKELLILSLFQPQLNVNDASKFTQRVDQALDTLLALQLTDRDLVKLQHVLRVRGRHSDADAVQEKLYATASDLSTQYNLLQQLQNDPEVGRNDRAVEFALRVFRNPAVSGPNAQRRDNDVASYAMRYSLEILKKADKLNEIVGQLETQYESSPDSIDLMTLLADVYFRADRKDDARKIADKLAATIPDDADRQAAFANLLMQIGMTGEAAEWNARALAAKPEILFNNFWEHERKYREAKKTGELIEILKKTKPEILSQHFGNFSYRMSEWMREEQTKTQAKELLDVLWNLEGSAGAQRRQMRMNLVRNMSGGSNAELYSYLREAVIDVASPPPKDEQSSNLPMLNYGGTDNPFYVNSWGSNKFYYPADTLIESATAANKLGDLEKEVKEIVAQNADSVKDAKPLPDWYVYAKLLEALIELRKNNRDAAFAIFMELHEDDRAAATWVASATALGQEIGRIDKPEAVKLAIEMWEKAIESQNTQGSDIGEQFIMPRLLVLYLKSDDPEKGREKAIEALTTTMNRLKMLGGQNSIQIGNRYYNKHSMLEGAWSMLDALTNNGYALDALLIYREHCDGQTWYGEMFRDRNYEYYSQQLQTQIDSIFDKLDIDAFVTNIDSLLPVRRSDENSPVLVELGIVCKAASPDADENERLVVSMLQDALAVIASENPAKYAELDQQVLQLRNENPKNPSVLLADAFFRFAAADVDAKRDALTRLAERIKEDDGEKFSEQILLGCWIAAREGYVQQLPNLDAVLESLAAFSSRYIAQRTEADKVAARYRPRNPRAVNPIDSLQSDYRTFLPESVAEKLTSAVAAVSLRSVLLQDNGRPIADLRSRYYSIRDQFVNAVKSGKRNEVMEIFRNYYHGNPATGYDEAYLMLFIFDAVIDALPKDGESFSFLNSLIVDSKIAKGNFLFVYDDLGGRNGTFRTPVIPLIDLWQTLADGEPAYGLMVFSEDMRKEMSSDSIDQFKVFERIIALKTKDWERFKAVSVENPMYALISVSPILDDDEACKQVDADALIDQALPKHAEGKKFSRFAHHVIERRIHSVLDSGDLAMAVRWATIYRTITQSNGVPNGFRFILDERLEKAAMQTDDLETAVSVLKYFSDENADSFRYRNLDPIVQHLEDKNAPFGDFDVAKIQRNARREKNVEAGKPTVEKPNAFPALPTGTLVYENDFETETGKHLSVDRRDVTPHGLRTYLGEFFNDDVEFKLDGLPEHQFVRIRFDLFMLMGLDGLVGVPRGFGEDVWTMTEGGNRRLIASTFSNFNRDPNAQKQNYPDDFPQEFGRKPDWNADFENDNLWGDQLRPGYSWGRTGAVEENNFGIEKSAVYAIDLVFPHDKSELVLKFTSRFRDGTYEVGKLRLCEGECWGLDNFRIEILDGPLVLSDEEFETCWNALLAEEPILANAARSRLTAAGDAAVAFLETKIGDRAREFARPTSIPGFRMMRVLDIIDTDKAKELKNSIQEPERRFPRLTLVD